MPEINGHHETIFDDHDHPIIDMCCGPIGTTYGESVGLALDAIVVAPSLKNTFSTTAGQTQQTSEPRQTGIVASSDFLVQFPQKLYNSANHKILIQINGNNLQESILSMSLPKEKGKIMCTFQQGHSTKPSTEVLEELVRQRILTKGRNLIRYILVKKSNSGASSKTTATDPQRNQQLKQDYTPIAQAEAFVFLWSVHDTIVISDIDGTVTKSDIRGVIDTLLTETYGHVHEGVCSFFSELVQYKRERSDDDGSGSTTTNNHQTEQKGEVRVLYLSSRPMRLINSTRKFVSMVSQKNQDPRKNTFAKRGFIQSCMGTDSFIPVAAKNKMVEEEGNTSNLPPGPIFLHSGTLTNVLMTELVKKSTHEFKADLLARQVVLPFVCAGKKGSGSRLFLAGFGNKKTDFLAYEMVGMNSHHIYIIDKNSVLVSTNSGLEYETESEENSFYDTGCFPMESMAIMSPKEDISSNKISVSNPKKTTAYASRNKRRFRGYGDPRLRKELLHRISSQ